MGTLLKSSSFLRVVGASALHTLLKELRRVLLLLSKVLLDLGLVELEHHSEQVTELNERRHLVAHDHLSLEVEHVEQLEQLAGPNGPTVLQHELEAVKQLLLFGEGMKISTSLFDVAENVLVALSLRDIEQVALLLLLPQVAFDIVRARLYIGLVLPDSLKLLLEQDLLVELDFLDGSFKAILLSVLDRANFTHCPDQRPQGPYSLLAGSFLEVGYAGELQLHHGLSSASRPVSTRLVFVLGLAKRRVCDRVGQRL